MTITGVGGDVCVGYQVAARLGAWTIEIVKKQVGTLTAEVLTYDEFWATQPGLVVRLVTRDADWIWRTASQVERGVWRLQGQPQIETAGR
ncbi:MAG: hypothetical protein PHR30_16480 [Gallionellaceae bacterium]|nr:hypothetical protein [Gallionellaceae bacterium]